MFTSLLFAVGTRFLLVPSGVSELALGPSPVLGEQAHFNPAAIGQGRWFSASGGRWLADIPFSKLSLVFPAFKGRGTFQARYLGLSDLELRPEYPLDESLSNYSAYGLLFSGGYARSYNKLSFGLSLSFINMSVYTESSNGMTFNAGVLYDFTRSLKFGAAILNTGFMNELRNENPDLPTRMSLGVSSIHSWNEWQSSFSVSADLTRGREPIFHLAESVNWKSLEFLAGTEFQSEELNISGGMKFGSGAMKVGYAFRTGQARLGVAHTVELSVKIK